MRGGVLGPSDEGMYPQRLLAQARHYVPCIIRVVAVWLPRANVPQLIVSSFLDRSAARESILRCSTGVPMIFAKNGRKHHNRYVTLLWQAREGQYPGVTTRRRRDRFRTPVDPLSRCSGETIDLAHRQRSSERRSWKRRDGKDPQDEDSTSCVR
jgi:hypothetical protein